MEEEKLMFFDQNRKVLPLYEHLETCILSEIGQVTIKVQKTQISFYNRHMFACVSFARVRKKKGCPGPYLVVTYGLGRKVGSPRVDVVTEPYPNRFTHHVLISKKEEIDEELMGWIKEASGFSQKKR